MLELRPNCEGCDRDLPPESPEAYICSYECTFCSECVEDRLQNVCPNCGGGFMPRPVRPATAHRAGISLEHQPASETRVHLRHDDVATFAASLRTVPPEKR